MKVISEIVEKFKASNQITGRKLSWSGFKQYNIYEAEIRDSLGHIESVIIRATFKELYHWIADHLKA